MGEVYANNVVANVLDCMIGERFQVISSDRAYFNAAPKLTVYQLEATII